MSSAGCPDPVGPWSAAASGPLGRFASALIAAATGLVLTIGTYSTTLGSAGLGALLLLLLAVHVLRFPAVSLLREGRIYAAFLAWTLIQLLWTDDRTLAINTLVPSANFLIALVLVGSLLAFHDFRAVTAGLLGGFLAGAAWYTATRGFPFSYPPDFSYNAVAGMYLFGLFLALVHLQGGRWNAPWLALSLILAGHIVATTSIKTNLGVLAGAAAAGLLHLRHFGRVARRNALLIILLAAAGAYAGVTNETVSGSFERGFERVGLGIEILQARDDIEGYSAFGKREAWIQAGIEGWTRNPVFGEGVEAFRARFGITSHSTAIDLLHNSGAVGFLLFYSLMASVLWRVRESRTRVPPGTRALAVGAMVSYIFISLSGIVHYSAQLAAVIAICVALLQGRGDAPRAERD